MTNFGIIEFWEIVQDKYLTDYSQRYGQIVFNVLAEYRPDLSEKVAGSDVDPFYVEHHLSDPKFFRFVNFLLDNW